MNFKLHPVTSLFISSLSLYSVNTHSQETAKALEEVVVTSHRQPYRGDVPLEELPQSVQILSEELLDKLQINDLQSALDLSASIARQNDIGGVQDTFAIRGFAGDETMPGGYLVNGFSAGRGYSGRRDMSNVERVEIMKGPGSALYGRGEPGGTINLVTKKPEFEREGYVQASAGRFDSYRVEGDYTDALSEKAAFRINGAYEDAEGYRNTKPRKYAFSPSVLINFSDATSLSYEMEVVKQEALFDRGIIVVDGVAEVPVTQFLGDPNNGVTEIEALGHQLVLQQSLAGAWQLSAGLGFRDSSQKGFSADTELSGGRQTLYQDGITLNRQRRSRDYSAEDLSGRIELSGTVDTGVLTHHLLFGVDGYDFELDFNLGRWRVARTDGTTPIDDTYAINLPNFVQYSGDQPTPNPQINQLQTQQTYGAYIQDQIDITQRFKVLLGVRLDDFEQSIDDRISGDHSSMSKTATSPRAGLVFDISSEWSLYASYAEGFRPNTGSDYFGVAFEPEESQSYETGVKLATDGGAITSTLAFFYAEKSNVLTVDPNPAHAGFSTALGKAESKGVEFDFAARITDGTNLVFSYAFIDAKTSNDTINVDWNVNIPAGSRLINIPKNTASLSLAQDFKIGEAPASAALDVHYVDERLGETIDPDYVLPAYTLVDLSTSYSPSESITLMANIDNLFDERYYANSYHKLWTMPGSPRTYTVGIRYSF